MTKLKPRPFPKTSDSATNPPSQPTRTLWATVPSALWRAGATFRHAYISLLLLGTTALTYTMIAYIFCDVCLKVYRDANDIDKGNDYVPILSATFLMLFAFLGKSNLPAQRGDQFAFHLVPMMTGLFAFVIFMVTWVWSLLMFLHAPIVIYFTALALDERVQAEVAAAVLAAKTSGCKVVGGESCAHPLPPLHPSRSSR